MNEKRANELIKIGEKFERENEAEAEESFDVFSRMCGFVEVPGGASHYICGNLKHADTRQLFLMFLGVGNDD